MEMIEKTNDNSIIAVIQTKVDRMQLDLQEIKTILKDGYATKDALVQIAKETEARLTVLEGSSNLWRFLSPSIAAILGSVLTFLIIQYLNSLR